MGKEIERKFLVSGDFFKKEATTVQHIVQGYLSTVPERTVRVRIKGDQGYITIKGKCSTSGASRFEWEKEISVEDAKHLLLLCEPGVIDKSRYLIPEAGGLTFEVDEFYGDNQGLILAELELPEEDTSYISPPWLGKEVTGDKRYYNAMLIKNPFKNWNH